MMGENDFPGHLLHQACVWENAELLEDLLSNGDEAKHVDSRDRYGRTPLHAAAKSSNPSLVGCLLNKGANPNIQSSARAGAEIPLHIAAHHGRLEAVACLLGAGSLTSLKNVREQTALEVAIERKQRDCIEMLKIYQEAKAERLESCRKEFIDALRRGDMVRMEAILEMMREDSPLLLNSSFIEDVPVLTKVVGLNDTEAVRLLLKKGANVITEPGTKGLPPLYEAAYNGNQDIVRLLLEVCPAAASMPNELGWLPLHAAVNLQRRQIVDILLNYDYPGGLKQPYLDPTMTWCYDMSFDINALTSDNQSPLYLAVETGNIRLIEQLLAKKVTASNGKGEEKAISPLHFDLPSYNGETALYAAVKSKNAAAVKLLLDFGADPNVTINLSDPSVRTNVLACAARNQDIQMVNLLIDRNTEDKGHFALSAATESDFPPGLCIKLLGLHAHRGIHYAWNFTNFCGSDAVRIITGALSPEKDHDSEERKYSGFLGGVHEFGPQNRMVMSMTDAHLVTRVQFVPQDEVLFLPTSDDMICVSIHEPLSEVNLQLLPHRPDSVTCLHQLFAADTEFKINKKLMELANTRGIKPHSATSGSLSYSAIFPTVPVAVSWQDTKGIGKFDESWLLQSAICLNPKVVGGMGLFAITKLDFNNGDVEELPKCVFRLQSLRVLNASNNRISKFPSLDLCRNSSACQCPLLQDVNLSHNNLSSGPEDLFYFPSLSTLDLSYNAIHCLPFAMWQAPVLKDINLAHNLLENLPLKSDKLNSFERSTSHAERLSSESSVHDQDVGTKFVEVLLQPVHRKNLWNSRLVVEAAKATEIRVDKNESALKVINLSFNAIGSAPLGLCCLAPNLSKLILANNGMHSMGVIQDYPAGLKHMDVSSNKLEISLRPGTAEEMDSVCYYEDSSWQKGKRTASLITDSTCCHRKHWRLDNLRTITLAKNYLTTVEITGGPPARKDSRASSGSSGHMSTLSSTGSSLLFPNLSFIDLSGNKLSILPEALSMMTNLSVLNIEGNIDITDIPPQMGLLPKLWTLNANGCNLNDPLKSMFENKQYKTVDILGYLKSSLERCAPYTRMKLMIVGLENKGKTSLLRALKSEDSRKPKGQESNWSQRMAQKNQRSVSTQLSTVGIDLGEWTCSDGTHDITFRTWDFAGQREYYATHQYFLSKRSVYLVVWNLLDGNTGIKEVTQWLVNIQARASGSPVIIVGTHLDEAKNRYTAGAVENLKREVRERFMGVMDADKHGLPRVVACIEVSSKTKQNIPQLIRMVAEAAWDLRSPGTNKRLMEQQIPAIYLALEDLVSALSYEYRESGQHPVVTTEYFRAIVAHELHERFNMTFRDSAELRQAVMFLHDNGILLHYEDCSSLKDLYFIDPQWLCDTLASVITVREINPFVKNGIMKIDDLKVLFKPSKYALIDVHTYILNLLNKFEVALKLDTRTLLIPSLLPVCAQKDVGMVESPLKIEIKSSGRNWIHFKPFLESPEEKPVRIENLLADKKLTVYRYYTMLYFPSGFWPRLISRLVSDEKFFKDLKGYFSEEGKSGLTLEWSCWQSAMELRFGDNAVLQLREISTPSKLSNSILVYHDTSWRPLMLENKAVMEITLPVYKKADIVISNISSVSMLLNRCVNHIDALLEDWYPSLGTRFIHTSTGQYLVTKFIPCSTCIQKWKMDEGGESVKYLNGERDDAFSTVRTFSVEHVIYRSLTGNDHVECDEHGGVTIASIAPETKFLDLSADKLLRPEDLKRGRILGRGAFGFVYRATIKPKADRVSQEVAVKMLIPVEPGFGSEAAVIAAYKSVKQQWDHEPLQSHCKAYWTARQELSILTTLNHHNIVGLVGLCVNPLGILLQLAPKGSLLEHLKTLKQNNEKLTPAVLQQICVQIAKALEYLHGFRIIYRDLKSDNVLVWSLENKVLVKLTDYGISRSVTAASTTKGFAGTEAYIAPEIIQYGGEEEYNEEVDVFSFGMLMYELLTLRQPFEGQEQVKDYVLDGGRPAVTPWTLNYPSLMLDLLVISWSQLAKDRPTSSQALSICNTPEFGHLQDVAQLEDIGLQIAPGGVFGVPDGIGIVLVDGTLNIVSSSPYSWHESKMSTPSKDMPVNNCLITQDFIWLLREREVSVHCAKTLDLSETFTIFHGGPLQDSVVDSWVFHADRQRVAVSLANKRILIINCHASLRKNRLVEAFCSASIRVFRMAAAGKHGLLGAGDEGAILVVHMRDDGIAEDCVIKHPNCTKRVADVVPSVNEGLMWTYLEEDATIFCWTLVKPQVVHKLDCERLIPVSESLNSIGIEDTDREQARRHICSMAYLEGVLYVGTVWGSLIVVQSQNLNPLSVIRSHVDCVHGLIPLRFPDGTRIVSLGRGYRDVISRFYNHDNVRQNVSPMTLCAVLWRTDQWALL